MELTQDIPEGSYWFLHRDNRANGQPEIITIKEMNFKRKVQKMIIAKFWRAPVSEYLDQVAKSRELAERLWMGRCGGCWFRE